MSVRLRRATAADLDWILAAEGDPENAPFVTTVLSIRREDRG